MDSILILFGWSFAFACGLAILIPYLRGRSDLITAWNLFLLGSANFVGLSAVNAGSSFSHYRAYTTAGYLWFYAGVATFYLTLWLTYRYLRLPQRMAGRWMLKWPPQTVSVLFLLLPICFGLSMLSLSPPPVPGLGQLLVQIGPMAAVFALTFAFVAWYTYPVNPILLWTLVGVAFYALVFSMLGTSGRRQLLAVLVVVPICLYWLSLRYKSRGRTLSTIGVMGLAGVLVLGAYSTMRHRDSETGGRSFSHVIDSLTMLPSRVLNLEMGELGGQNAVEVSLLAIHVYREELEPEPFYSTVYVLVNPIPRALWPEKPTALGQSLPAYAGVWRYGYVNWGPGIVGHGFQEGGLHMLVFYGLIVGGGLRFFDELMSRQPGNPFLLGVLCTVSGQIIAWPRGDIGVFTMQIISGVATGLLLAIVGRVFFGTGVVYPRTDHLVRSSLPAS